MENHVLWTNDVETHSIWFNCLRDETAISVIKQGMPLLLDLYAKYNIRCTFYFTGYMASKFPEVVKMILPGGHEVASHGYTHDPHQAFDILLFNEQRDHLLKSKKILEDISGQEVISFRAPALRVNSHTPRALIETGFKIDSSVASQRFDMFLSFGSLKKMNWLLAPRLPYRVDENNLFKKGNSPLVEIPISAMLFPYVGTTMRIFPLFTRMIRRGLYIESRTNYKPIVFDIHPNELINEEEDTRHIQRRATNYFSYILSDILRSQLKVRNLGIKAVPIYEKEIAFFNSKNFTALPIKEYCKMKGLLA